MTGTPRKDLPFPLSKCMDVEDAETLKAECQVIHDSNALDGQHPARWWEYALAHRAIEEWNSFQPPEITDATEDPQDQGLQLCDIGGAGSKFAQSLSAQTRMPITLIDPTWANPSAPPGLQTYAVTVEDYAAEHTHSQFDCLTCISVIEHLDNLRPFLRACRMLLKPGGLLFLTTDCWNLDGEDVAHFHWMRKRIYNPELMRRLSFVVREIGFASFGRTDWTYHGNTVFDYSFASLAMVKK